MQTFITYKSFRDTAKSLDNKRLGKQRVECYQILKALSDPEYGWQNHPAVKMWRGWEPALIQYGYEICREWISRGFNDTCELKITQFSKKYPVPTIVEVPNWLNDEFIRRHRSNLIRKMPEYYSKQWSNISADLEYIWPIK